MWERQLLQDKLIWHNAKETGTNWWMAFQLGSSMGSFRKQSKVLMQTPMWRYGWDKTKSHGLRVLWRKKDDAASLSVKERASHPLPGQAFIAFLGTLHWGWSSFTMHRFALGGYLLQKTKERMLLTTSKKKDICKCKGKSGWTGYTPPWEV